MSEISDFPPEPDLTRREPEEPEKARKPTHYVVLVSLSGDREGPFTPLTDEEGKPEHFEAFRRTDLVDNLTQGEEPRVPADLEGFTYPVAIMPARNFDVVRYRVGTRRYVEREK